MSDFVRTKSAKTIEKSETSEKELEKINLHTLEPLSQDDVFTFKLVACDNEIDRDKEAFTAKTLKGLAVLYVGKTIIADHMNRAENQLARIYDSMVVEDSSKKTSYGVPYVYLLLKCYIPNNDGSKEEIESIKAGIKKEVSVGCAVNNSLCSICGERIYSLECGHRKGETYQGKMCFVLLDGAKEAYEVSFVAVPAQRAAGVVKTASGAGSSGELDGVMDALKEISERLAALQKGAPPNKEPPLEDPPLEDPPPKEPPTEPPEIPPETKALIQSAKALTEKYA